MLATRPAFVSVTFVGVLIGWASAWADGVEISGLAAALTMIFELPPVSLDSYLSERRPG